MNPMIVGLGGVCALAATAPLTWALVREWAGQESAPSYRQWRDALLSSVVGVLLGIALLAAYPAELTSIVLIAVGITGIAGGAATGWVTRAPENRDRR